MANIEFYNGLYESHSMTYLANSCAFPEKLLTPWHRGLRPVNTGLLLA